MLKHRARGSQYNIGSSHLPGLSKLVEELGECSAVAGKIVGLGGLGAHWDGTDLAERLAEEMADVVAAVTFVIDKNYEHRDRALTEMFLRRTEEKLDLFHRWHEEQNDEGAQSVRPTD